MLLKPRFKIDDSHAGKVEICQVVSAQKVMDSFHSIDDPIKFEIEKFAWFHQFWHHRVQIDLEML